MRGGSWSGEHTASCWRRAGSTRISTSSSCRARSDQTSLRLGRVNSQGGAASLPDIFIPQLGVLANERAHHFDALGIVKVVAFHPMLAEKFGRTGKIGAFARNDFWNSKLH